MEDKAVLGFITVPKLWLSHCEWVLVTSFMIKAASFLNVKCPTINRTLRTVFKAET